LGGPDSSVTTPIPTPCSGSDRTTATSATPLGIRLASALEHGDDHRSQVCTALTLLGIEPPEIDVWAFGLATDRSTDLPPDA
jgi:uncharacterized damage-inducible protein DinB